MTYLNSLYLPSQQTNERGGAAPSLCAQWDSSDKRTPRTLARAVQSVKKATEQHSSVSESFLKKSAVWNKELLLAP